MSALFQYLLGLGDDRLVLGHRLSEWCGHGPVLEEDIALTNIALDLIGHASLFLGLAGRVEDKGRDADALAYLREGTDFRNLPLVEFPRGDFAFTTLRQFLFDAYSYQLLTQLEGSTHQELAGISAKALKETTYHLRRSSEWVLRLGDGTEESHQRTQAALESLWPWTGTMFHEDALYTDLHRAGITPALSALVEPWSKLVTDHLIRATLTVPSLEPPRGRGYRRADHTEHLGHLLTEMQFLARANPGAAW